MKRQIVLSVVFAIFLAGCSKTKGEYQTSVEPERVMVADEKVILEEDKFEKETVFTAEISLDDSYDFMIPIIEKYGRLFVTYEVSKEKVLQNNTYKHNVVSRKIFVNENGKEQILGTIRLEGVFDKNGKCIVKHPFMDKNDEGFYYLGYDLNNCFEGDKLNYHFAIGTNTFYFSPEFNEILSSEVYAFLKIDTENDTLAIIENPY